MNCANAVDLVPKRFQTENDGKNDEEMRQGKRSSLSRAMRQVAGKHGDDYLPLFSKAG